MMLTGLTVLLCVGAAARDSSFESGHRKLPLSSLSQPAYEPIGGYEPTRKPTSSGGYAPTYKPTRKPSGECEDDETWEYPAGDKGYKRCDHVAKKPDPRCGRVSDDGVVASVACPKACGRCD